RNLAGIELLHEGPQRPLGVGLNLPKHGRNYPYKARHGDAYCIAAPPPFRSRACWLALIAKERYGYQLQGESPHYH
ncbi:hypothetical protein, partial [Marinobacter sp. HL-58]|uniref:hypothetical protein n=1 Tax=Marinobacter sp. HL-58 TaxID=1479237 RepID=UPI0025C02902